VRTQTGPETRRGILLLSTGTNKANEKTKRGKAEDSIAKLYTYQGNVRLSIVQVKCNLRLAARSNNDLRNGTAIITEELHSGSIVETGLLLA
jgi:hypothetical protein